MNQPFTEGRSSTDSTKKKNRFMWMTITATAGAVLPRLKKAFHRDNLEVLFP